MSSSAICSCFANITRICVSNDEKKSKTKMKQLARIRQDRHHVETNGGWWENVSILGAHRWYIYISVFVHFIVCQGPWYICVCIIYWGTQIILVLRELFKKINMRHFLGSLHQVSPVYTQNIWHPGQRQSIVFNCVVSSIVFKEELNQSLIDKPIICKWIHFPWITNVCSKNTNFFQTRVKSQKNTHRPASYPYACSTLCWAVRAQKPGSRDGT